MFEGAILTPLKFFPKRSERDLSNEMTLLYQKISDLESELLPKNTTNGSISANVIFGGGYIFSDSIFLDKGALDGIEVGDFVVYKSSIVFAKIEEVFPKYSKVSPFSRFGQEVSLRSGFEKNILFKAEGKGGREISALLPSGSGINAGDMVYLAQSPRFLVGLVEVSKKKESRDFEEIKVVLPFFLRSISEVDIIKNNVQER